MMIITMLRHLFARGTLQHSRRRLVTALLVRASHSMIVSHDRHADDYFLSDWVGSTPACARRAKMWRGEARRSVVGTGIAPIGQRHFAMTPEHAKVENCHLGAFHLGRRATHPLQLPPRMSIDVFVLSREQRL